MVTILLYVSLMFEQAAFSGFVADAAKVLASPFWLLLILSVVAWRYGNGSAEDIDSDPAE